MAISVTALVRRNAALIISSASTAKFCRRLLPLSRWTLICLMCPMTLLTKWLTLRPLRIDLRLKVFPLLVRLLILRSSKPRSLLKNLLKKLRRLLMHRSKISKSKSKRIFRKTASKTHPINMANTLVQRGGIHLAIAIVLMTVFCGCKFAIKDFNSSVGELSAETKGN